MMRVTVEIWPNGDHLRPRRMATLEIANVSELNPISNYSTVAVLNPGQADQKTIRGYVRDHFRDLGWATLVRRALEDLERPTMLRPSEPSGSDSEVK